MRWSSVAVRAAFAFAICGPAWSTAQAGHKTIYTATPEKLPRNADVLEAIAFIASRFDNRSSNVGWACDGGGWILPSSANVTGGRLTLVCPNGVQVSFSYNDTTYVGVGREHKNLWVSARRASGAQQLWNVGFADLENEAAIRFADFWQLLAVQRPVLTPATDASFLSHVQSDRAAPDNEEQLRRVQVQAETLLKGGRTLEVARMYRTTLATDAAWAQGHYNLALVYGSLELYPEAITEMRRYLYLDPSAADARAAKDQVYGWEALLPAAKAATQ